MCVSKKIFRGQSLLPAQMYKCNSNFMLIFGLKDDMQSYPGYRQDVLCGLIKDGGSSGTVGLPLNVQVVGRPWQEELVLHVMETLEELAEFKTKFKPSP